MRQRMALYNHMAGLKIVGETQPDENNRVELSDELDELGIPIPKITFSFSENDKRLYEHSLACVSAIEDFVGAITDRRPPLCSPSQSCSFRASCW